MIATYASILDPTNNSPHRSTLSIIREMRLVDERTVDFQLERADPYFPSYLVTGILPARLVESGHLFSNEPVGNGPFRLRGRDAGRVVLEAPAASESEDGEWVVMELGVAAD